jgi:hypothetical protein
MAAAPVIATGTEEAESTEPQQAMELTIANAEAEITGETPVSIMDIPLDGASTESFKAGLEQVDEQATEKQYRSVMSALDYLLFYELSVQRNKDKLYASLDGKTPNEIVEMVRKNRKER